MKILILGAAGEVVNMVAKRLATETDNELVLFARRANARLTEFANNKKITIVDGDYENQALVEQVMNGIDVVVVSEIMKDKAAKTIVEAMKKAGVKRLIISGAIALEDLEGPFKDWNIQMLGGTFHNADYVNALETIKASKLDYTLIKMTWLYNDASNLNYELIPDGQKIMGTQVSRNAVADFIMKLITTGTQEYNGVAVGIQEPNTAWDKPSFY